MTDWLIDTFVWTAALIALVLVLRRPVARYFGAPTAYALWALPMVRLLLPAIELPAWMNPNAAAQVPSVPGETMVFVVNPAAVTSPDAASWFDTLPLTEMALASWLGGAAVFLFLRFRAYYVMRSELLADARTVGQAGKVRLIETPATNSPLALGVRDKIVALPDGFMARYDREARDLALAHELAHHQGHDLLANMVVQPLFALHWFNPLARIGWLAMRRDQEAACDARVVKSRDPAQRANYANLIASFAAGPKVALAAPMACPVLGDKSIIQRLRSLKMNEFSSRRRLAGRGLLAAALVALPLTASISYAEPAAPEAPAAPAAPVAPLAPAAPNAPDAPLAPPAPPVPMALHAGTDAGTPEDVRKVRIVIAHSDDDETSDDGKVHKIRKIEIKGHGDKMSTEEHKKLMAELDKELAEIDVEIDKAMKEHRVAMVELKDSMKDTPHVAIACDEGDKTEFSDQDGRKVKVVCVSKIIASARSGLEKARDSIAKDKNISADVKAEILRSLDREIAQMEKDEG